MNMWMTFAIVWLGTLVLTGWVFHVTGNPWSFAILLLLSNLNMSSGENENKKGADQDE